MYKIHTQMTDVKWCADSVNRAARAVIGRLCLPPTWTLRMALRRAPATRCRSAQPAHATRSHEPHENQASARGLGGGGDQGTVTHRMVETSRKAHRPIEPIRSAGRVARA